jgi:hypothetical protein
VGEPVTYVITQMMNEARDREVAEYVRRTQPLRDAGMTDEQVAVAWKLAASVAAEHREAHEKWATEAFTRLGLVKSENGKRWVWPRKERWVPLEPYLVPPADVDAHHREMEAGG